MTFLVRTATEPLRVMPSIGTVLRSVDRNQPAITIAPMDDVLGAATAEPRFQTRLLGIFALLAVALSLVGTYGVLSYSVAQRTHEIGLRMALGAQSGALLWTVLRRTAVLGAIGVAIGLAGAAATTRVLSTFLFQTTPTDPPTFAAVAVLIFLAALAAGFVPARRATRVDPLIALRHE
jgi:putative ABC transport system permease protein